jgi:hypothetical protein
MKIYVASSWRNTSYPEAIAALRADGHEVLDWRIGNAGFRWPPCATERDHIAALETDPDVAVAYQRDKDMLDACNVCVLLYPCGISAHIEAMYAASAGKRIVVVVDETAAKNPELMLKLLGAGFVTDTAELIATLRNTDNRSLAETLAREEMEKADRLIEAGYSDLLDKVRDGEIDIDTAMQIFDGRRP